jgi:hypothetical protein
VKKLLLVIASLGLISTAANAASVNAPFPQLKPGQKLCQASIPPGDPFYRQCMLCDRKGGVACTGDLRDRERISPYLLGGKCFGKHRGCR